MGSKPKTKHGNDEPPLWSGETFDRPLPSSEDSERVILGAALLDESSFAEAAETLLPEDFYNQLNRKVFSAMLALTDRGEKLEPIFIGEELRKEGSLEAFGGVSAITNLTLGLPYFTNLEEYIGLIREKSLRRQLIKKAQLIVSEAWADEEPFEDVLDRAEAEIMGLEPEGMGQGFKEVFSLADTVLDKAQKIASGELDHVGLMTGFVDLDSMTHGLAPGDLVILAGRPSMGKSALGVDIGRHVAFGQGKSVAMFALEMSDEQIAARILSSEAQVRGTRLRAATLSEAEWHRLAEARAKLNAGRFSIDDTPGLDIAALRRRARRMQRQLKAVGEDLALVIVDYLQLMEEDDAESRQQGVSRISRGLKALAKELGVPVLALSQLSRQPEGRSANKHRPILSDLRESGAIEQDADIAAFVWREEMYANPDGSVSGEGEAELIVAKQRNGPTGTIKLSFRKEFTKFENYSGEF